MHTRRPTAALTLAAALALGAAAGAEAQICTVELTIDLKTDLVPQIDFDVVESVLSDGADFHRVEQKIVRIGDGPSLLSGLRVATFTGVPIGFDLLSGCVPNADPYLLTLRLLRDDGAEILRRLVDYSGLDSNLGSTVVLTAPGAGIAKRDTLFLDFDDDGATAGDSLLYTIELHGPLVAGTFEDRPGPGAHLVPGSVIAGGTVVSGNGPTDDTVRVDFADLAEGEVLPVSFFAEVDPVVSSQGELFFVENDTLFGLRSAVAETDDPDTLKSPDATVTRVGAGDATATCRAAVVAAGDDLALLLGDSDGDGVVEVRDDCAGTAAGEDVDARGCSQAEFCGSFDASTLSGLLQCYFADWRDDEPLAFFASDCRPALGTCSTY